MTAQRKEAILVADRDKSAGRQDEQDGLPEAKFADFGRTA